MPIKRGLEKLKTEGEYLQREVLERALGYIITAFGLIAGLAWNEAVKALIEEFFPFGKNTLLAKFIYAIIVTLVIVIVIAYLLRLVGKKEEK